MGRAFVFTVRWVSIAFFGLIAGVITVLPYQIATLFFPDEDTKLLAWIGIAMYGVAWIAWMWVFHHIAKRLFHV